MVMATYWSNHGSAVPQHPELRTQKLMIAFGLGLRDKATPCLAGGAEAAIRAAESPWRGVSLPRPFRSTLARAQTLELNRYSIWRFPGEGPTRSYSCRPAPQPQQRQIRATSLIYTTSHGQCQILNPLSEARDRTCNLMVSSQIRFHCTTAGTLVLNFLILSFLLSKRWEELLPCGHS